MVELEKVVNNLKASPLFNMSLGSKELFHSNFLAWLLEISINSNNIDIKLFLKLLFPEVEKNDLIVSSVVREFKNFDLFIC